MARAKELHRWTHWQEVPTPQALVDRMLDMAKLTPADRLVDLGSGDGITVITAAKGFTAKGMRCKKIHPAPCGRPEWVGGWRCAYPPYALP